MKKALIVTLCISLALCSCSAFAQSAGNLNNGGFIEKGGDRLFIAASDGIYSVGENGDDPRKIVDGRASMLQYVDGRLYYLAEVYAADEYGDIGLASQEPMTCLPDGSDAKSLGEAKKVGYEIDFPENEGEPIVTDVYVGYRGFTVYNGFIYYLANSGEGGNYECSGVYYDENDKPLTTTVGGVYKSGIKLYKAASDGSDAEAITGVIGNSVACFAVSDDKIYLCGGYADTVYAYNYVNYSILGLDGGVKIAYTNPGDDRENLSSDIGEFYHIPSAVLPYADDMLVSLSDSEGDFVASQLNRVTPEGETKSIAIEQEYVHSITDGNALYYVGSAAKTNSYDDGLNYAETLGIYRKDVTESGLGVKITALPFTEFMYGFNMSLIGDYMYYRGGSGLIYRVPALGGELCILSDTGFSAVKASDSAE